MNLTTRVAVRKIRIHKKIIPAKVRAHPPSGRWKWSKRGGNRRDRKIFSNLLLVVRREALSLAFMSYKHTHDVQDGRNAPSLVAGEMTHWSVTLSIKLFIYFRNKFHFCFILCLSRGTSIMISYFLVRSQPRPQGAFPWLWPPKPGKSALGTRLVRSGNSDSNSLI